MAAAGAWRMWRRLYLLPMLAWAASGVLLVFAGHLLDSPLRRQREADFRAEARRVVVLLNAAPEAAAATLATLVRARAHDDRIVAGEAGERLLFDTARDSTLWPRPPAELAGGTRAWHLEEALAGSGEPRDAPLRLTLVGGGPAGPVRVVWTRAAPTGYAAPLRRGLFAAWLLFGVLLLAAGSRGVRRIQSAVAGLRRTIGDIEAGAAGRAPAPAAGPRELSRHEDAFDLAYELERQRRRMDQEISRHRQEARERADLWEKMPEGLLALDGSRRVALLNAAACRLLGVPAPAPLGARFADVVRVSDLHRFVEELFASGAAGSAETEIETGGGGRVLQVRGTTLSDPSGARRGLILSFSDVTDARCLERVRKDFVDNVSHELKTPLTTLHGCVETLLDGAGDDPDARDRFLRTIEQNVERMRRLVEDLLSLSRIESQGAGIERRPIALEDLLARAAAEVEAEAEACGVTLTIEDETGGASFPGNQIMLERALANLVDNAVKYGGQGGGVRLRARRDGSSLCLEVIDRGPGIPAVHHGRLFERFYRVDRGRSRELGGTGLGLAIVKHVALAHGGEATVASEPGRGSTFALRLPWTEP